jgi:5'-3' exonuclease
MSKAFTNIKSGDTESLMLVDALNLSFRWKHKKQRNFAADYLRTIDSLASSYGCGKILICADKGSSSYRRELYPEYKANRKERFAQQTPEEEKEFLEFLEDYEKALELVQEVYPVIRYQGVEADDLISVISRNSSLRIWIVSTDKDLDQLITDKVSRFSYITRKEITLENFRETYGCDVEEYISIKVLQGDAGDNVKGIEGVGPKRALALIRQFGSAFDIHDSIPLPGKLKYIQAVNEAKDLILLNYKLMDLSFSQEALGSNYEDLLNKLRELNLCNM